MHELESDKRPCVEISDDNPTKKQYIGVSPILQDDVIDKDNIKKEKAKMAAMIIALILQTK